MWLFCAIGTAICFGLNNFLFKWGTSKQLSKLTMQFFFNLFAFLIVLAFGVLHGDLTFTPLAFGIGGLIGMLNANGNLQMTRAFEKGPASVTSTIIAMNSILVVVATAFFFPEVVPPLHWVGVGLMATAAVVVQYQKATASTQIEYRPWMMRCLFALFSVGSVGVLLKIATSEHLPFYSIILSLYAGGVVFLGALMRREFSEVKRHKVEISLGLLIGVLSTTAYSCYLFALQTGPSSVVFPIISLNCLVVMVAGLVIFKEKLKNYQLVGILAALAGLVLTKI